MILSQELQKLGLPKDNVDAISKIYKKNKDTLRKFLKEDIFSFNKINDIYYKKSYFIADKYNNFYCSNEKESKEINKDNLTINSLEKTEITLCFDLKGKNKNNNNEKYLVNMDKETLRKLIQDLENYPNAIKKYMKEA